MSSKPPGQDQAPGRPGRRLGIAFLVSVLAVGVPYFAIPYSQITLPHAIWGPPLVVVVLMAAWVRWTAAAGFWKTTLVLGSSVPAVIMLRVVSDAVRDPSSHNLWPFEHLLAAGPGLLAGAAGALLGGLLRRIRQPDA